MRITKLNKILIANRGEIALRIMKSCKEMGIKTVAVFSESDREAPFLRYADEAEFIGESPSSKSYLNMQKIINAAKKHNVQAIHPGYGFLSENPKFARLVEKEGIIFIGPSPKTIEIMGDKLVAKQTVKKYNIELVPGSDKAIVDKKEAKKIAKKISYPVLIKAAAGGGGKGMRLVKNEDELETQMERAISEAQSSFGDGSVFIEKYIESPKHIEVQILADKYGNTIHLFERECSIQRRHQKIIEEAPSAIVDDELRNKLGEAAVKVAKACNYTGAGTVEFIMDKNKNFYFLEMNTRLQVEHPVTEMITGIDLVKEQIKIAKGEKLSFKQKDIKLRGHSIEIRVYAEDPLNNFLPDIGILKTYRPPKGIGIRVDDAMEEGMTIPVFYDPMIAKLIVYANNRDECIKRMTRAIEEFEISGVATTLDFCKFAINHNDFKSGNFDTNFIEKNFKNTRVLIEKNEIEQIIAAIASAKYFNEKINKKFFIIDEQKAWKKRKYLN